CQQNDNSPPTF
nr:immunoglobulin light chain junction region [Macaca mulatta]MOW42966.1 immunoglobulin light chain junction region [Macaca mulatta]MOW43617.1 immunoglobulin light chain junction region [Macaca mulatta]MOW43915.1 immunoglobulin light chain junction region [Macaca mulatta]